MAAHDQLEGNKWQTNQETKPKNSGMKLKT